MITRAINMARRAAGFSPSGAFVDNRRAYFTARTARAEARGSSNAFSVLRSPFSTQRGRRGFTLIELLVVISILVLVVAISVPAIGPMLASNHQSQAISILSGILTTAQTRAAATGTAVGIRFERAIQMHERGVILDVRNQNPVEHYKTFDWDRPAWLNFQRARLVEFATGRDVVFRQVPDSRAFDLPKGIWVAPSYCLNYAAGKMAESQLRFDPKDRNHQNPREPFSIAYNRMETFFVVFDSQGELTRFDAGSNYYADATERRADNNSVIHTPLIACPDESARAFLLYDRSQWESINAEDGDARLNFMQQQSRSLYISRVSGAVIQEVQP